MSHVEKALGELGIYDLSLEAVTHQTGILVGVLEHRGYPHGASPVGVSVAVLESELHELVFTQVGGIVNDVEVRGGACALGHVVRGHEEVEASFRHPCSHHAACHRITYLSYSFASIAAVRSLNFVNSLIPLAVDSDKCDTYLLVLLQFHLPSNCLHCLLDNLNLVLQKGLNPTLTHTLPVEEDVVGDIPRTLAEGLHPLVDDPFDRLEPLLIARHQFGAVVEGSVVVVKTAHKGTTALIFGHQLVKECHPTHNDPLVRQGWDAGDDLPQGAVHLHIHLQQDSSADGQELFLVVHLAGEDHLAGEADLGAEEAFQRAVVVFFFPFKQHNNDVCVLVAILFEISAEFLFESGEFPVFDNKFYGLGDLDFEPLGTISETLQKPITCLEIIGTRIRENKDPVLQVHTLQQLPLLEKERSIVLELHIPVVLDHHPRLVHHIPLHTLLLVPHTEHLILGNPHHEATFLFHTIVRRDPSLNCKTLVQSEVLFLAVAGTGDVEKLRDQIDFLLLVAPTSD